MATIRAVPVEHTPKPQSGRADCNFILAATTGIDSKKP